MKFSIHQKDLLDALQIISSVVPTRSTTPILENILFDLDSDTLKLTGTDLEVTISTQVKPENVESTGSVALPARVVTEMIKSLEDIVIQFELDDNNRIKITTDQGFYQVAGLSKDNFPEMPAYAEENAISIDNGLLSRMFSKTIFAVSTEELRPALMGVYLQIKAAELRMVATDGHRLSQIVNHKFDYTGSTLEMIIPPKAVQITLKNLEEEGSTKLIIDGNGICFILGDTVLYTRMVEGTYPDYERVIPRDNDKKLTVDKSLIIATLRRVSLFSSSLTRQIRFSLSPGKLAICSEDADIGGEAREELAVEYDGEEMEIGYNAQYAMDIIRHVDSDEVLFILKSPVHAALIQPVDAKDDESFLMLLMPIKLSA